MIDDGQHYAPRSMRRYLYGSRSGGDQVLPGALGTPLRRRIFRGTMEPIYGKLKLLRGGSEGT